MGLPPGVEVGGLGKRFRAHMTDNLRFLAAPPYLAALIGDNVGVIIQIAATVLMAACGLFVWQGLRVSRPGVRVIGLQLVGFLRWPPTWMGAIRAASARAARFEKKIKQSRPETL